MLISICMTAVRKPGSPKRMVGSFMCRRGKPHFDVGDPELGMPGCENSTVAVVRVVNVYVASKSDGHEGGARKNPSGERA